MMPIPPPPLALNSFFSLSCRVPHHHSARHRPPTRGQARPATEYAIDREAHGPVRVDALVRVLPAVHAFGGVPRAEVPRPALVRGIRAKRRGILVSRDQDEGPADRARARGIELRSGGRRAIRSSGGSVGHRRRPHRVQGRRG